MRELFKDALISGINIKTELQKPEYTDTFEVLGNVIYDSIKNDNKLLFCGNGGSAADAQHLAAELLVRLRPKVNRDPIAAVALSMDTSTITACGNDFGYEYLFERNIRALGKKGDVLICISTSGMSKNLENAAIAAKSMEITTIGFLGNNGGKLKKHCDHSLIIPSSNTARIQECHIILGHSLMEYLEEKLLENQFINRT
tara:strand:+ start:807 stop:1406 length:600 start_codon:yes stop_codon:yes gene_type:complete